MTVAEFWDAEADAFDDEPHHGLRRPEVRAAWADRLRSWLPPPPADVLDLGCGTGTLSLLLADLGHRVAGADLSTRMAARARAKLAAAGHPALVLVADATDPPVPAGSFDVVLVRHLVWTLPDPHAALRRWAGLLRPGGRLVLVEGRWKPAGPVEPYVDGASAMPWLGGVPAAVLADALEPLVAGLHHEPLADPVLWGQEIADERYAMVATV